MALARVPVSWSAAGASLQRAESAPPRCRCWCAGVGESSSPTSVGGRGRRVSSRLQTQEEVGGGGGTRRRLLVLLLGIGGGGVAQLHSGGHHVTAAAAVGDIGSSPADLQERKAIEFGFDGQGKTPDEYALGKVVALAQAGDGAVLFLGVDGFEVPLQLVVGPAEAMAVLTAAQERKSRRPVTHEAWGLSLAAVGWKVDRVVITGTEKDVFYSNVVLSNLSQLLPSPSGVKKSVDMRPSDGIALALRCRAPLFVHRKVAEEILNADSPGQAKTVDPLKQPGLQASHGDFPVFVTNSNSRHGIEGSSGLAKSQSPQKAAMTTSPLATTLAPVASGNISTVRRCV